MVVVLGSSPFLCSSRNMSQQMGDSHRRFLQIMMGCAVVSRREAESLHRYCCEAHTSESFKTCSHSVNLHYKINEQYRNSMRTQVVLIIFLCHFIYLFQNIKAAKRIKPNPHLLWWHVLSFSVIFKVMHYSLSSAAQYVSHKLDDFINIINSKLQPLFMQIRKGMSEESGEQCYALVSEFHFSTRLHLSL